MRCKHGFEPAAVKCPKGCHGPQPRQSQGNERRATLFQHARSVTNERIIAVLATEGSASQAAKRLGIDVGTIHNRAKRCAAVKAALDARAPTIRQMGVTGETARARDQQRSDSNDSCQAKATSGR